MGDGTFGETGTRWVPYAEVEIVVRASLELWLVHKCRCVAGDVCSCNEKRPRVIVKNKVVPSAGFPFLFAVRVFVTSPCTPLSNVGCPHSLATHICKVRLNIGEGEVGRGRCLTLRFLFPSTVNELCFAYKNRVCLGSIASPLMRRRTNCAGDIFRKSR